MAIDSFLDFKNATPSIPGEAQDQTFGGTFHVKSFSFTVAQKGSAVVGTGMGAGKAEFEDFEFTIDTQKGSPKLLQACAAGTHFQKVTLNVRKAGGDPKVFLVYKFMNVLIASFSTSGEEESTDTVKFNYASVYAEYTPQKTDTGELDTGNASRGGWDLKLNKSVETAPFLTAEELIHGGQVDEALAALQDGVRKAPADPRLRRFLFQLLCVMGRWEKAVTQLQVLAEMDVESMMLAQIFRPVIACEMLRAEVFQAKRTALIFGEPEEWVSWAVQAHNLAAQGEIGAAKELQQRALEAAPAVAGQVNEVPFEWIADADSRLGPLLEAYIDSKYYWIPLHQIRRITLQKPSDLRDLVWIAAKFSWVNGGESAGLIPSRYPGSETSADGGIRLARKTEWIEKGPDYYFGLGQRMLATDAGDYSLLEIKSIDFAGGKEAVAPEPAETAPAPNP